MNTFLPFSDYSLSAQCLDDRRLNKQIIEGWQILQALFGKTVGWQNHPATLMWSGYPSSLLRYIWAMLHNWEHRKGKRHGIRARLSEYDRETVSVTHDPPWLGWQEFHAIHRGVLLDKDFAWYSQFGWKESPIPKVKIGSRMSYPYIWPSKIEHPFWERK